MGVRISVSAPGEQVDYEFDQARIAVGRGAGTDIRLPHAAVSTLHATFRVHDVGYVVVDEGSTNGTWVNGGRIAPGRPKALRPGDVVEVGGFRLVLATGVPIAQATSAERTAALARKLLRAALGERSDDVTRITVLNGPGEGTVLEVPPPPVRLVIGRGEEADLRLEDGDASREHAEIVRDLDGVVLRDLGSKNGLVVNDKPARRRRLRDRDEILIGATLLLYEDPTELALEEMEVAPDAPWEPPAEAPAPPPPEPTAAPPPPPAPSPAAPIPAPSARRRPRRGPSADVFIYVLAAVVIVLSGVGLFMLFGPE
jgi:pSer/pThr/pTyr-binding forkhead associated (FHA) protein